MANFMCHFCQVSIEWSSLIKIGRRDSCTKCSRDLHICLNCKHYDPSSFRQCRETISEAILDKEKANFCDVFEPGTPGLSATKSKENLMSAAEALFKKK